MPNTYHAFISYSHKDKAYASIIQSSIETLGLPFYRVWKPNVNIFRDERKIPLSANLTNEIKTGLTESRFLIVIASKNSADSQWVKAEITNWHALNKDDDGYITNFNFILVDDVVEWDAGKSDFDQVKTTALPKFQSRIFRELPIWANLQPYCKEGKIQTDNANYEWEIAKVKGLILNKKPDEIIDAASAAKKSFRLTSLVVMLLLTALTISAFYQRNTAIKQRNIAQSNYLVSESRRLLNSDPTMALRICEESQKIFKSPENTRLADKIYSENNFYKIIHRQRGAVTAFAPFADGRRVVCAENDSTARIIDAGGKVLALLKGHHQAITGIAVSNDQKFILTGSLDHSALLWGANGHFIKRLAGHQAAVTAVAFSNTNNFIATGSKDCTVMVWNAEGVPLHRFKHKAEVNCVAFSSADSLIAVGTNNGTAHLWNQQGTHLQAFVNHMVFVNSIAFSPDDHYILAGAWNEKAQLWKLNGKLVREFKGHRTSWAESASITSVAFSANGEYIFTASLDHTARMWDFNGRTLAEFIGHQAPVSSVSLSADHKSIVTSSMDGTIRRWALQNVPVRKLLHRGSVSAVAFSADGKQLITGSWDSTAVLWNTNGGEKRVFKHHKNYVSAVALSKTGHLVLTGSWDNTVILQTANDSIINVFRHDQSVNSLAISRDNRFLLVGTQGHVYLRDLAARTCRRFKWNVAWIGAVCFSPDENLILASSADSVAYLHNRKTNLTIKTGRHASEVYTCAFSPNGKMIITGTNDGSVYLWNLNGRLINRFKNHKDYITSAAFTGDGQNFITTSGDGEILLCDLTGSVVQRINGTFAIAFSAAVSPNQRYIIAGSNDSTARLWQAAQPLPVFLRNNSIEALPAALRKKMALAEE